jgi:hypothetical protein
MTTRAERRAQRAAIKVRRIHRSWWVQEAVLRNELRHVGMAIDTPKPCSCEICGNPRAYSGDRSIQERRHDWR